MVDIDADEADIVDWRWSGSTSGSAELSGQDRVV